MTYRLGSAAVGIGTSTGTVFKTKLNKLGLYPTSDIKFSSGKWVVAQYQNMSFAVSSGTLHASEDSSVTFPTTTAFTDANKIISAYIYENGNILFMTTNNKVYLTDIDLTTPVEKTVYESDGVTPITIHTPSNATYPGWYFHMLTYQERGVNETMHVWGNYGNAHGSGANPTNIYYSTDYGVTTKIAYKFGQNLNYRDNGTANGSDTTGTILGDSGNTILTRHVHYIGYDPVNDKWYAVTGDHNEPDSLSQTADEINWFEGVYTSGTDSWVWTKINFGFSIEKTHRLKAITVIFHDGYVYWGSDNSDVPDKTQNGLWKSPISTITDLTTHRQIYAIEEDDDSTLLDFRIDRDSGVLIGCVNDGYPGTSKRIFAIENYGLGKLHLYKDASADFYRMEEKNSDGYYKFDYYNISTLQTKSFFIRIGNDFFDNL